eukprot:m51a1_g2585 hypothetical protein (585) ;mRNA; r:407418-412220
MSERLKLEEMRRAFDFMRASDREIVNANVLVFLREISHFVESANLDEPNAHHLLLSKLVGRAAVVASSWLNLSVAAFTARMVRTWAGEELMVRLRDELDGLVQQPGQSAADLAATLNQLYDRIDPATTEATRLERFKRAVTSDKAHGAFIAARPRTVEEAVVLVADAAAEEARMERAQVAQGTTGACFTEIMRSLGYDPSTDLTEDIDTEEDRVQFLKVVAQVMVSKARIKINTKKLYSADVYAVKELQKLAQVLYEAMRQEEAENSMPADALAAQQAAQAQEPPVPPSWNPAQDVKTVKQIASDLTSAGATIHGLLEREASMMDQRARSIRGADSEQVERAIRLKIKALGEETQGLRDKLENLGQDEVNLKGKTEKKKQELERSKTRLQALRGMRPQFMDEYEKLEEELQRLYTTYLEKLRNLDWLEAELDALGRRDDDKNAKRSNVLERIKNTVMEAERQGLKDGVQEDGTADDEPYAAEDAEGAVAEPDLAAQPRQEEPEEPPEAPAPKRGGDTGSGGRTKNRGVVKRVQGSVAGPAEDSDDSISPVVSDDEDGVVQRGEEADGDAGAEGADDTEDKDDFF